MQFLKDGVQTVALSQQGSHPFVSTKTKGNKHDREEGTINSSIMKSEDIKNTFPGVSIIVFTGDNAKVFFFSAFWERYQYWFKWEPEDQWSCKRSPESAAYTNKHV